MCANARDRDYGESNHYCSGEILLVDSLDEEGGELVCPDCDRSVYPERYGKQRFEALHTRVSKEGVGAYVLARLSETGERVKEVAGGVFNVDVGRDGVTVCIVDHCEDEWYLARDRASISPTCYIVVNNRDLRDRFLPEEWLCIVSLADVVASVVDLGEVVVEAAGAALAPPAERRASVPIYTRGAAPVMAEQVAPPPAGRKFVIEVGPNQVRVDGQTVIAPQAGPRLHLFRFLWERFLGDCLDGRSPEDFQVVGLDELTGALEDRTGKEFADIESVRRTVNRMQGDIETAVKRHLGHPIDRDDIIETVEWSGQGKAENGYRLNPASVTIRPFQAGLR
ncbi:MAG: hypothetical protein ACE5FN_12400 [Leptospirillia bacterium]